LLRGPYIGIALSWLSSSQLDHNAVPKVSPFEASVRPNGGDHNFPRSFRNRRVGRRADRSRVRAGRETQQV